MALSLITGTSPRVGLQSSANPKAAGQMRTYANTVTKEEDKIAKFKGKKGSDVRSFVSSTQSLDPLCRGRTDTPGVGQIHRYID